jgi:hypothetical protein
MKNPSRLSRLPNRLRPETGKIQKLEYVGTRIKNSLLLSKLPELPKVEYNNSGNAKVFLSPLIIEACMIPDEVMNSRGIQGRNAFFHWLGHRMDDVHMSPDKKYKYVTIAYNNLRNTKDFDLAEALMAARVQCRKN